MVETKTITITISDHYAVEFTASFWTSPSDISTEKLIKQRNLNKLKGDQYLKFSFLLDQKLKSLGDITDVDNRFEILRKIIMDCLNRFAPNEENSYINKKNLHGLQTRLKMKLLNVINCSKNGYYNQMITIEKDMLNNEIESLRLLEMVKEITMKKF